MLSLLKPIEKMKFMLFIITQFFPVHKKKIIIISESLEVQDLINYKGI